MIEKLEGILTKQKITENQHSPIILERDGKGSYNLNVEKNGSLYLVTNKLIQYENNIITPKRLENITITATKDAFVMPEIFQSLYDEFKDKYKVEEKIYTTKEARDILGISMSTLQRREIENPNLSPLREAAGKQMQRRYTALDIFRLHLENQPKYQPMKK